MNIKYIVLFILGFVLINYFIYRIFFLQTPIPILIAPKKITPYVSADGQRLVLNGNPYRFVGVNRYNLLTDTKDTGCGNVMTDADVDTMFSQLHQMHVNAVRFWMFQSYTQSGTSFTRFDYVLTKANMYGIKVIPVFENQWGDCTQGGKKNADWYASGYLNPYGNYQLSLKDYINSVLKKYSKNKIILLWQIMNESEDPDEAGYIHFARDVSSYIKTLDPNHMVSLGTIGSSQPPGDHAFRNLNSIPTIDIIEYHDYHNEYDTMPGYLWERLSDSTALQKPLFVGESGIGSDIPDRAGLFEKKMNAFFDQGGSGYLIWSYWNDNTEGFNFNISDPVANTLKKEVGKLGI